jgi:hypothetical protein
MPLQKNGTNVIPIQIIHLIFYFFCHLLIKKMFHLRKIKTYKQNFDFHFWLLF